VNGDTVGDDSLADLDDLTSGDLVATLAKIITGDVQIEARSLQQAFAEANASLRLANTLIGEYSLVEDNEDDEPLPALEIVQQRPLIIPGNGHVTRQPSLFSSDRVKPNGTATTVPPGGNGKSHQQEEFAPTGDGMPPVPRPRLLIEQLGAK
ncbi:MAG TPA: hypothetical protein PLK31_09615, partial [Chloroflexota bacterium]|nr:hypothetical protein [Chloroflexota bacterium]